MKAKWQKEMNDKMEQIQYDLQRGMRVQDVVEKYSVSSSTVTKYLKLMDRNDEDLKNFRYSDEYKELMNIINEDDPLQQELKNQKEEEENAKKQNENTSSGKKKKRKTKKEIIETASTAKKKFFSDNGSDNNSSDSIKLTKKEEKNNQKDQEKLFQANLKDMFTNKSQKEILANHSLNVQTIKQQQQQQQNNSNQSLNSNKQNQENYCNSNQTVNTQNNQQTFYPPSQNNALELRINPLLKLREQADKVKLSHHMFPFYYKQHPSIGITFKNQVNFFTIDGKNSQLGQYKIEQSSIYQDNFIKSINILQSRAMARDIIFIQSMSNLIFTIDSTTYIMKQILSGIEYFDFFRIGVNKVGVIGKQGLDIIRYTYKVEKEDEMGQNLIEKRVLCQINPVMFLELSKIILFMCGTTRYLSFLCKTGLIIYKQDQQDQRYNQIYIMNEPGLLFVKPNPKCFQTSELAKYQLYAISQTQLFMYSSQQNSYEKISIQNGQEVIKDFVVAYNSKINKEFVVVAYSRKIVVIVDKQVGKMDISTESDIKSIQVFWIDKTMQLCYQTVQDDAMKFNIEYFEF